MYLKLAVGNVRRSLRDYTVYMATLAFAACLLYAFNASTDYLTALALTAHQRENLADASGVMRAFSVFIVIVFAFLLAYGNRFLLRRRKREFGAYALLGMEPRGMATVLLAESLAVGAGALAGGLALGVALSPAFGALAAFVFNVPWQLSVTFSPGAALWSAACFAAIALAAALFSMRSVRKQPLVALIAAERTPERRRAASPRAQALQVLAGSALLAVVWGTCLFQPGYFVVLIVPMGFAACGGTYLVLRVAIARVADRMRRHTETYYRGLRLFSVRQVEARVESSAAAMSCVSVLVAAAVCMIAAGLAFSVGMHGAKGDVLSSMAPIGYVGVFYGASFIVAAAAVLALQQVTAAVEGAHDYRALSAVGAPEKMVRRSVFAQVGAMFSAPIAFALVHDLFGLALVLFLALNLGAESLLAISAGTVGATLVIAGTYYLVTASSCARMLAGRQRGNRRG